jgi:hypothetical protein
MPSWVLLTKQLILKGLFKSRKLKPERIAPLFVIRIKKVAIYESSKNCYDLESLLILEIVILAIHREGGEDESE